MCLRQEVICVNVEYAVMSEKTLVKNNVETKENEFVFQEESAMQ